MRGHAILMVLVLFFGVLFAGCHFFDDFDDLSDGCPFGSGYPCACDPDDNGGLCDDDSSCVYWEDNAGKQGICSAACNGPSDQRPCQDSKGYGTSGICWMKVGDTPQPNACIVRCESGGESDSCPPGMECAETIDNFSGCVPPAAINDNSCDCSQGQIECSGDNIGSCEDGCNWSIYSCDDICADSGGYSGSCSYNSDKGHDVCWCQN